MKLLLNQWLNELQKHFPSIRSTLNPPATDFQILEAEAKLHITFPQELRELLLCANGQVKASTETLPLFPWIEFGSGTFGVATCAWLNNVEEIVLCTEADRQWYQDLKEERFDILGPATFHDNTIAFTSGFNADTLQLDLNPSEGGTIGQILCLRTQPCQIDVLAPSLTAFFELMLDCMHRGEYEILDGDLRLFWNVEGYHHLVATRHDFPENFGNMKTE